MGWLVPRSRLTPTQLRAVELSPEEHRVFAGPPGCGKTLVLVHRAAHLRDRHGVSPDRFRILVFTNALVSYIRSALPLLDIPAGCVSTFDSWCVRFYRGRIGRSLPKAGDRESTDFPAVRKAVAAHLRKSPLREKPYDFVMVDEGQDLDAASFEILRGIAAHVTVCTDSKQQIFESGSSEREIVELLGVRRRNLSFLEAYRCCPYVARLGSRFIGDPEERSQYLAQVRVEQGERETPLLFVARSKPEEVARMSAILRLRLAKGERVAVILPRSAMVYGYAKRLQDDGIEVETYRQMNFDNLRPKLISYHSAKGLTVDTVLLPRLTAASFRKFGPELAERLLFVGITRAQRWVYMSTVANDDNVFAPLRRLIGDAGPGCIEVQYGSDGTYQPGLFGPPAAPPRRTETPAPGASSADDDDLTSLL